ncbi:MAG TPA: single-stranded DNA-binding protein [Ruminococcaceae bacterium]|nr:single-stranded DNA-binding protein [Oscillospiraceae bacterium]
MLNVVALNGRLVADPELKSTGSDISVTSFCLAVDRSYQRQGEDRQSDFINVVCWRKTAEFVCDYFHKGQLVAVEGSLQTRKYTDRNGNNRTATEVVANTVHFAESKKSSDQNFRVETAKTNKTEDFVEVTGEEDLPF